ncbi:MAG TPA: hypothetical protein DDY31_12305 [Lachnospiraceae bacterium]|nr:hypothetical protein [Lachnospiraceae bacterium]
MRNRIKRYIPIEWKLYLKYLYQTSKKLNLEVAKYILLDFGNYGNAGDNAIGLSILDFVRENISDDICCFMVSDFYHNIKNYKRSIGKDTVILLSGGGNLGISYLQYERVRETVCLLFPKNPVIIFPQTMDFGDLTNSLNRRILKEAQRIYSKCSNLTICAREKQSYDWMRQYFPCNRILLLPDIVFRYRYDRMSFEKEKKVIFCFRTDGEKRVEDDTIVALKEFVRKSGYFPEWLDTCDKGLCFRSEDECREYVNHKIDRLSAAKLVVTDRLHGMIFAYISGTPCIVFPNNNHKIRGVYQWISASEMVSMANHLEEAEKALEKYLAVGAQNPEVETISNDSFENLIRLMRSYNT